VLRPNALPEPPAVVALPAVLGVVVALGEPRNLTVGVDERGASLVRSEAAHIPSVDLASSSHAGEECLPHGRACAFLERVLLGDGGKVDVAGYAAIRLVHALPAHDDDVFEVAGLVYALGELAARVDEVVLEVVLDVDAVNDAIGREVFAGKEHCKYGTGGETVVIRRPDHLGERVGVGVCVLDDGGLGGAEALGVQATGVNGPHGGAGSAGEARPDILVRIHEDVEAIGLCDAQDLNGVLNPRLVVDSRAGGLDGLPGEDIADGIEAVTAQPRKVRGRIVLAEGPLVEGDVVAVKEVVADVGRLVGFAGHLSIASDVDAT